MMGKQHHILLAGIVVLAALGISLALLHSYSGLARRQPPHTAMGLMLQGAFADKGWNHRNYEGAAAAAEELGISLDSRENIAAGSADSRQVIRTMEGAGKKLLFLGSADYAGDMDMMRREGSKMVFAIPALEQPPDSGCIPYFLRLYQGEYLSGVLAGMRTRSGKIGYVASMPIPETVRGINAFALGVRRVNPGAQVVVYWMGSWDDAAAEKQGTSLLIEKAGVDIVNSHQDRANVQQEAARHGVDSIAYQEPMEDSDGHAIAVLVCDWSAVYRRIMQDYQQGQLQPLYWEGIQDGAINLTDFSGRVTEEEKQTVSKAKQEIREGFTIFSGELRDQQGIVRCAKDESLSDNTLIHMDWFVEGVRFYEK